MVESDFLLGPVAGTILSLPLFDGGQRKAGVAQARAAYEESVANYRQTVLNAFREVENGLSDQRILDQQIQAQNQALSSSRHANQLSHLRYREGAISYLDVIDSDRTILQQEQLAAQLKGSQIIASINLIRALGAVGIVNKKRLTALFIYTNYFAYTGNFAQTASTFAFTSAITFSSPLLSITSAIQPASSRTSVSPKPRVVTAGVPIRIPEVTNGERGSFGTEFCSQ